MKAVFAYTFKNAFFKVSTFVIIGFSLLIPTLHVLGMDPSKSVSLSAALSNFGSNFYVIAWLLSIGILLGLFTGMKATSFVADELEDGTFLTVISKPLTRMEIIIGKYLAVLSTIMIYVVIVVFIPIGFLTFKFGTISVFNALLPTLIKILFYALFFVIILLALVIPLSIKVSSKIVVALCISIPSLLVISSLVIPMVLGVGGINTMLFVVDNPVNKELYDKYMSARNTYSWVRFIDIPSHFSTMFNFAASALTGSGTLDASVIFGPPTWVEFTSAVGGTYKVVSRGYALNPIGLFVVYGLIASGLSFLTIKTFVKEDFM